MRWNGLRGLTEVLRTSNKAETDGMSNGERAGTYLGVRDAKHVMNTTDGVEGQTDASTGLTDVPSVYTDTIITANVPDSISTPRKREKLPDSLVSTTRWTPDEPNGCRNRTDASTGPMDVPCVETHTKNPTNTPEIVSIPQKRQKPPDSPSRGTRQAPDEPNGSWSHADTSSVHTDVHSVGSGTQTAGNKTKSVRSRQNRRKMQDSPIGREIATPEIVNRWRKVSVDDGNVYVPWNAPIEVLETANRRIVFGRVESGGEAIAPSVEGERAGDGDGDGNGGDGDGDGTTSSGNANSKRVGAALLAGRSQYMRQSRRIRNGNDLPMSSGPPIQPERCPYGLVRRRRRRGRLKIERINDNRVSQTKQVETTYLERTSAMQPPGNTPKRAYGVIRPRRRRRRIKIKPRNVNRALEVEKTYLGRTNAIRSTWRPRKQIRRVNKLTFDSRKQGERWRDDRDYG